MSVSLSWGIGRSDGRGPGYNLFDNFAADGLRVAYNAPAPGRYFVAIYAPKPNTNETTKYTLLVERE